MRDPLIRMRIGVAACWSDDNRLIARAAYIGTHTVQSCRVRFFGLRLATQTR
jgi:hypothetical protein